MRAKRYSVRGDDGRVRKFTSWPFVGVTVNDDGLVWHERGANVHHVIRRFRAKWKRPYRIAVANRRRGEA
jgi:hypothetical protein